MFKNMYIKQVAEMQQNGNIVFLSDGTMSYWVFLTLTFLKYTCDLKNITIYCLNHTIGHITKLYNDKCIGTLLKKHFIKINEEKMPYIATLMTQNM